MSVLGLKLRGYFDEAAKKRIDFEQRWLRDLRQYKGIYDPDVLAKIDPKRSRAFIRETRTKVRTLDARVMDLLFPANGDKNWELLTTPVPTVNADVEAKIIEAVKGIILQSGEQREPTEDEVELAKTGFLEISTKGMSNEIEDQLAEIKYRSIIRNVVHSGHLYGTGWLKGPLVDSVVEKHWELLPDATGNAKRWTLVTKAINRPYAEAKSIWVCYPDMSATELDQCRYFCERHIVPRHELNAISKREDFAIGSSYIMQHMADNPDGKTTAQSYEGILYQLGDNDATTTVDTKPKADIKGSYELIEIWGYLSGSELLEESGSLFDKTKDKYEENDPVLLQDYPVNAWILDNEVVKLAIEPIEGVAIPYYTYYFDKDETSIFGEGLASVMRDPQRLSNASVRAMIDNAAHCAGPQYEVNIDLLADGEDPTDIGAFKVWQRIGKDADIAGKEVVRVKTIASYTNEFMAMQGLFSRLGDEVTIVPRYLQGDARVSGAGRTAQGLSMLMGQANVGLSDLIKFFDDGITKPFITNMYYWNMQFNPKEHIKGDLKIAARGSTALMAKEIRAQQIQMFLQMTLNPEDKLWVKRGNLLRKWADSSDIGANEMVRTQEEYDAELLKQQQMLEKQIALQQSQGGQQQGGAGYNQLESIVKQLEDFMGQLSEKVNVMEQAMQQNIPQQQIQQ